MKRSPVVCGIPGTQPTYLTFILVIGLKPHHQSGLLPPYFWGNVKRFETGLIHWFAHLFLRWHELLLAIKYQGYNLIFVETGMLIHNCEYIYFHWVLYSLHLASWIYIAWLPETNQHCGSLPYVTVITMFHTVEVVWLIISNSGGQDFRLGSWIPFLKQLFPACHLVFLMCRS